MTVTYTRDALTGQIGFSLLPSKKEAATKAPRKILDNHEINCLPVLFQPVPAQRGEVSLVQLKLAEDSYGGSFSGGRTMRASPSLQDVQFVDQNEITTANGREIYTILEKEGCFRCVHILSHDDGDEAVTVFTEFENISDRPLTLEMLSSFCLGDISPFDSEDSVERLRLHRFRSVWSAEGRHEAITFEDLHLERTWLNACANSERFGQVGSMPVRGWFPFAAIEDVRENVFWAAQLACGSSWQLEAFRLDDKVSLSGGLADREFGHWMKCIEAGETFTTPRAFLTTATGNFDQVCQRLVRMQQKPLSDLPQIEQHLPILFNEWCASWGSPTPEFIADTAERLSGTPIEIFVIDDGWAEKPDGAGQFNGDWNVATGRFKDGLKPVANNLREHGFIPGLWFEFEVCTQGTSAFDLATHKLRRDGRVLQVGTRHFWDFTDPWTFDYLSKKVISRLRDDGFSYLKVDYNDTIGLGCDDPDSLGEGLRRHIAGVQRFFRRLRRELPDLIIEVCSSGGHRLEPSFLGLAAMGSFSDAHECPEIPIIAANLHRLIHPRQNQIWAVLHAEDSLQRIHYSLAATFLGRVCLSGDITQLSDDQFALLNEDLDFYTKIRHLIRDGESILHRELSKSWRRPRGWQAVVRTSRGAGEALTHRMQTQDEPLEALVVVHAFGEQAGHSITVPLPPQLSHWEVIGDRGIGITLTHQNDQQIELIVERDFSASVVWLRGHRSINGVHNKTAVR